MKTITIFEGPDGSGKTTAALTYADAIGARYVHLGPFKRVSTGLARLYVEAMLPALLGYQDVVMDRCWLSEAPYGEVFRNGQDRIEEPGRRMLERIAMRCSAIVVLCLPGYLTVQGNFLARPGKEMLKDDTQLLEVYQLYNIHLKTELPELVYDYTTVGDLGFEIDELRTPLHSVDTASAGNLNAPTVLVGESFADYKNQDPLLQFPFVSFDRSSCSWWLTEQLAERGIGEMELFWLNADQDLEIIHDLDSPRVFALGQKAGEALYRLKINATTINHPQHHRRFKSAFTYPLFNHLKGTTS